MLIKRKSADSLGHFLVINISENFLDLQSNKKGAFLKEPSEDFVDKLKADNLEKKKFQRVFRQIFDKRISETFKIGLNSFTVKPLVELDLDRYLTEGLDFRVLEVSGKNLPTLMESEEFAYALFKKLAEYEKGLISLLERFTEKVS